VQCRKAGIRVHDGVRVFEQAAIIERDGAQGDLLLKRGEAYRIGIVQLCEVPGSISLDQADLAERSEPGGPRHGQRRGNRDQHAFVLLPGAGGW